MTAGTLISFVVLFAIVVFLALLMARLRRRVGGGVGPTFMTDGSATTTPTGHPTYTISKADEMEPTTHKMG